MFTDMASFNENVTVEKWLVQVLQPSGWEFVDPGIVNAYRESIKGFASRNLAARQINRYGELGFQYRIVRCALEPGTPVEVVR